MSRVKKFFVILAVIFIIIGLILTGISLSAAHFDVSNLSTVSYETKIYEFKESFNVINVDDIDCDIRIIASGNDVCKVTVCDTAGLSHQVEVKDKALQITLRDTRKWYEHIGIFSWEEREVVIQLPEKEYRSILLKTISGDIEFDAFDAESIEMETSSGDVEGRVNTPKNFIADTSSGEVTVPVSDFSAGDFVIRTVSGDIKIELE